ncbi:hypothetical protein H0H92_000334 [Tricholoma furcatifolium]|nr:hypothetical protein H0H92_000334 [Tricholoma furcatifolium]
MPAFTDILDALEADILCFQEVKSSRSSLTKRCAVPPSYHAFFSFPVNKTGYSGVSTYVRTTSAIPLKAEEGLCGVLQPKPPLKDEERVSDLESYPQRILEDEGDDIDYKDLDSEGRTLTFDFGLFVLINVYCPNDGNGTDERNKYKADFHTVLEARVRGLVEREGREVIVVGDLNACAAVIDHCEGPIMVAKGLAEGLQGEDGFWGKDCRRWMRDWMVSEDCGGGGPMIDITRRLWPDRKGMYTCAFSILTPYKMKFSDRVPGWNTKISARDSNYGTRIDYIMITRGLLPWIKAADIQPHIRGSDHCPVYVDLHDEIVDSTGATITLKDAMGFKNEEQREPPRIASKFWDEYSGKQRLLQQFFGKSAGAATAPTASVSKLNTPETPLTLVGQPDSTLSTLPDATDTPPSSLSQCSAATSCTATPLPPSASYTTRSSSPTASPSLESSTTAVKRKLTADTLVRGSSKKKLKAAPEKKKKALNDKKTTSGQATLASFFAKPQKGASLGLPSKGVQDMGETSKSNISQSSEEDQHGAIEDVVDADYQLALLLSSDAEPASPKRPTDDSTKQAWSTLMAPIEPPKCAVHGEPAKEMTVTKAGPNKGKKFFICSR